MLPHGPDTTAFEKATNDELKPVKLSNTMAFMFETRYQQHLTRYAAESSALQQNYAECWKGLERKFNGSL
jgi:homogentisate 1,2-dioxygenase